MGDPRRYHTMRNEPVTEHTLLVSTYMGSDFFYFARDRQTIFQSGYTNDHLPSCDESSSVGMPGKLARSFVLFRCKGTKQIIKKGNIESAFVLGH